MIENMNVPVRCPEVKCAAETFIRQNVYSETRHMVNLYERWSEGPRLLAWILACGHVVDPGWWMLVESIADATVRRWFAPHDAELPMEPPSDAVTLAR